MKKSELKQIIKECYREEVGKLNEARSISDAGNKILKVIKDIESTADYKYDSDTRFWLKKHIAALRTLGQSLAKNKE